MKISRSVEAALDCIDVGDFDQAMMHACNALDGTAKRAYPMCLVGDRFTRLLRDHMPVLEIMGLPGLDGGRSRFAKNPVITTSPMSGAEPDIADLLYSVHRCSHAHGEDLPEGFEFLPKGKKGFSIGVVEKTVQLPVDVIFGVLGVVVLCATNADQAPVDAAFRLWWSPPTTLAGPEPWITMPVGEWWGRADEFLALAEVHPRSQVVVGEGDWLITVEDPRNPISITAVEDPALAVEE